MAVNVLTVGPGTLTIGSAGNLTNFESQTTSCRLVPNVENDDAINVLSGEQVAGDRTESFTLEGTFLQDFGDPGSKVEWLFAHRGETHPFKFIPNTSKGKQITGDLQVEAVEIGGAARSKPTSDFEFAVIGEPVIGVIPGP